MFWGYVILTSAVIVLCASPEIDSSIKKQAHLENCLIKLNSSSSGTSALSFVRKSTTTSSATTIP